MSKLTSTAAAMIALVFLAVWLAGWLAAGASWAIPLMLFGLYVLLAPVWTKGARSKQLARGMCGRKCCPYPRE